MRNVFLPVRALLLLLILLDIEVHVIIADIETIFYKAF